MSGRHTGPAYPGRESEDAGTRAACDLICRGAGECIGECSEWPRPAFGEPVPGRHVATYGGRARAGARVSEGEVSA